MTRSEAAIEALRLRKILGNKPALEFIADFKFVSGLQWTPKQIEEIESRASDRKSRRF